MVCVRRSNVLFLAQMSSLLSNETGSRAIMCYIFGHSLFKTSKILASRFSIRLSAEGASTISVSYYTIAFLMCSIEAT